jgi:hypothetical protein
MPLLSFAALLVAHVEIQLPPAARCELRPMRYPTVVYSAVTAFDPETTKLAIALAQQDLLIIRSNNQNAEALLALAKTEPCADQERLHTLTDVKQNIDAMVALFHSEPADLKPIEQAPFLGVTLVAVEVPGRPEFALRIDRVLPTLPAWRAGVRTGDLVLAMNGESVASVPMRDAVARLTRRIRALPPGSSARFSVLRYVTHTAGDAAVWNDERDVGTERAVAWTRLPEVRDIWVPAHVTPPAPALRNPLVRSAEDNKLETLINALGPLGQDDLFKRIAAGTARPDVFRLPVVDALQRDPIALRGTTRSIIDRAVPSASGADSVGRLLQLATGKIATAAAPLQISVSPAQHLKQLRERLDQAERLRALALRKLSEEAQRELAEGLPLLVLKYLEHNYVYADSNAASLARNLQTIDLAAKIDLQPLLDATALLLPMTDPAYLKALAADLTRAKLDLTKAIVLEEQTPYGIIRIAGMQDDDAAELDKVALLIDLGGNDFYREHAGTGRNSLSVVIDLSGDDTYEASTDVSLGAGVLGVGILADLNGNDHYLGTRLSQGVGLGGVGVLLDSAGRDEYRASQFGQAASLFGVGILHDASGDDRYEGRSHTQGVAVGGGAAMLVDGSGDDVFYAKGAIGSSYGTPGTYDCWCQGAGIGMRYLVSGGLGLLYDGGGKDRVEGGDFSQGAGYYFGFGIAAMRGKDDDRYVGNRYTMSASAHNGIAAFVEEGGSDRYDMRANVAALGLANDYAMAWFFDGSGNDRYPAQMACGGVSMNNGFALFEDTVGKDEWVGPSEIMSGQSNTYHAGTSLSLVSTSTDVFQKGKSFLQFELRDQRTVVFRLGKPFEVIADDASITARIAELAPTQ